MYTRSRAGNRRLWCRFAKRAADAAALHDGGAANIRDGFFVIFTYLAEKWPSLDIEMLATMLRRPGGGVTRWRYYATL